MTVWQEYLISMEMCRCTNIRHFGIAASKFDNRISVACWSLSSDCVTSLQQSLPSKMMESTYHDEEAGEGERGIISIFHGCMVWIEKYVTRVTDRHHEALNQCIKHT